eukprot:5323858-Karenia_brevis.AAC.1
MYDGWKSAFDYASTILQSEKALRKNRPWISDQTLEHIEKRNEARSRGRKDEELKLNKLIKRSVKSDRHQWFQSMLEDGDWTAVQKYRKC